MSDLVDQPYDKFWDSPPTRRELQRAFAKMGQNDAELMGMCDTQALVLNYILEVKFGNKDAAALKALREEIDIYVAAKNMQVQELRAKMKVQLDKEEATPKISMPGATQVLDNQADGVKE
jgi:hypothetical protein